MNWEKPEGDAASMQVLQKIASIKSHSWIMVYDNADTLDYNQLEALFPPGSKGNVLLTSRNPSLGRITSNGSAAWCVELMDDDDSITLFCKAAGIVDATPAQHETALRIIKTVHYLPLAIDQAGAIVREGVCSLDNFVSKFEKRRDKLMRHPTFCGASSYEKGVYTAFDISHAALFARSQDQSINPLIRDAARAGMEILRLIPSFAPIRLHFEVFRRAAECKEKATGIDLDGSPRAISDGVSQLLIIDDDAWDDTLFRAGLGALQRLSLITITSDGKSLVTHTLIYAWCSDILDEHAQLGSMHATAFVLMQAILFESSGLDQVFARTLVPHLLQLRPYAPALGHRMSCTNEEAWTFGEVMLSSGMYEAAVDFFTTVRDITNRHFGEEDPNMLGVMNNLALAFSNMMGQQHEALAIETKVLEIRRRTLGEEHPDTLTSIHNLASTLSSLGRHQEALAMMANVVETRRRILGEEHPETLDSESNLAVTFTNLSRHQEALAMEVTILERRQRIRGEEHPDTLTSMNNLASTFSHLDRHQEALVMKSDVLKLRRRVLGDEHPHTLRSMNNLAETLSDLKRHEEALDMGKTLLEQMQRICGREHSDTLVIMQNLARTLSTLGREEEALTLRTSLVEIRDRILAAGRPDNSNSEAIEL